MNAQDFCTWLNGYVELGGAQPDKHQWEMIKEHLALVFTKTTRSLEEIKGSDVDDSLANRINKFNEQMRPITTMPMIDPHKQQPWQIPDLPPAWTMPTYPSTKPFEISNMPTITC